MKFREIFRFEFSYQIRRVSTWLFFAVLLAIAFLFVRGDHLSNAQRGDYLLNAPYVVALVTVFGSLLWLLVAASIAGEAAARDVQTRMHSLTYTNPVSKREYLGGRFLAAFLLNALILLAVPAGILLAWFLPGVEPGLLGPFRLDAFFSAYFFIALPNAFIATSIQFSFAALKRRPMASYIGSVGLFVTAYIIAGGASALGGEMGKLLDPIGTMTVVSELGTRWTPIEKNTRVIELEGFLLVSRVLWLCIALGFLALTYSRFRFAHHAASPRRSRIMRRQDIHSPKPAYAEILGSTRNSIPQARQTFGFATRLRQTLTIAWISFRRIAKSRIGFVLLAIFAMLVVMAVPWSMVHMSVPLLPRTQLVITFLTAPLTNFRTPWVIVPLLTVLYAGELIWREREHGLGEITDATPVPEWVFFMGKFLGLSLILVGWLIFLALAGVLVQVRMGYFDFEIGLYLKILLGLQLTDYLLFAVLAFLVHVLVNQKHIGNLVGFLAYGVILFATGWIENNLLVYSSAPGWSYTDMSGFGPFLTPWLWFKSYWMAWALLLAVLTSLFWVRSREGSVRVRFRMARGRLTRPVVMAATAVILFIVTLGGFVFYNTNVLNKGDTMAAEIDRLAEYERRYMRYENVPQPRLTGTRLHVDIYPERSEAEIRGTYSLVNNSEVAIDSIHLATSTEAEIAEVNFDRLAARVLSDGYLGHRIYALNESLQPGDSMKLDFKVDYKPRGFSNSRVDAFVIANGSFFTNQQWLPAIGYQPDRELNDAVVRREHGLAPRPRLASLYDTEARRDRGISERIAFEAVVGTNKDQIAVAPGALRRTWTEGGRRYFHYTTDTPIPNQYGFFSADYAVHEGQWNDVVIRIYHYPGHEANLDRMLGSVRASLDTYTKLFGPYPYGQISLIEHPGGARGAHAEASRIWYEEGFTLFNPKDPSEGLDLPFTIVAHEVAHQWWGAAQLEPARVEGAILLVESLATYSGFQVSEATYGREHVRRHISQLRSNIQARSTRAGVPLLRNNEPVDAYSKGPIALYAVSQYIGVERVNAALRSLLEEYGSGKPPLPTSLDLYRELQAASPDSLQYLLHDLFEANTFWELETEQATAEQTEADTWQVVLSVHARKVVVDSVGIETVVPMNDWVEVGVFASAEEGNGLGEPLYMQKHRIRSGEQTITVTVPRKPFQAGIDPNRLLIDLEMGDNVEKVIVKS